MTLPFLRQQKGDAERSERRGFTPQPSNLRNPPSFSRRRESRGVQCGMIYPLASDMSEGQAVNLKLILACPIIFQEQAVIQCHQLELFVSICGEHLVYASVYVH